MFDFDRIIFTTLFLLVALLIVLFIKSNNYQCKLINDKYGTNYSCMEYILGSEVIKDYIEDGKNMKIKLQD